MYSVIEVLCFSIKNNQSEAFTFKSRGQKVLFFYFVLVQQGSSVTWITVTELMMWLWQCSFVKCRQRSNIAEGDCWLMHRAASPQHHLTAEFKLKIEGVCSGLRADKAISRVLGWDFARERFLFFLVCFVRACVRVCVADRSITALSVFPYMCCTAEGVTSGFNEQKKIGSDIEKKLAVFFFVTCLFVSPTTPLNHSQIDWT